MSRRPAPAIAELLAGQPVTLGAWTGPRGAIRWLRLEPDGSYTASLQPFDGEPFAGSVRVTGRWARVAEALRWCVPCYRETAAGVELLPPPVE